jgi:hypothetical protein
VSRLDCLTGKLFIARSVKFKEGHTCTSWGTHCRSISSRLLVDVVLWDSDHTSDLDQISYDDGAASDLDEQVIADPTPSPVWAQQTLQATGDLVGDLADTLKTRS